LNDFATRVSVTFICLVFIPLQGELILELIF
jgi:hypothetical protein